MIKNLTSFKRQIEILSMFYPIVKIKDCKPYDLAEKYGVSEVTINRDLKDLRRRGIPINTVYGKGVEITGEVNQKTVADLIVKYIAMYQSDIIIQNTLFKDVNERDISQVFIFSSINEAIDNKKKIVIQYKFSEQSIKGIFVLPCKIIYSYNQLQFVGVFNNTVGAFAFKDILSLTITPEKDLANYDSKIDYFLNSKILNTSQKILLKLQIANSHTLKYFNIHKFNIKILKNDLVEAETNHYSIDDLAKWVIGQYGKVKVLEPKELRDRIVEIAKSTLEVYTNESSIEEFRKNIGEEKRQSEESITHSINSKIKNKKTENKNFMGLMMAAEIKTEDIPLLVELPIEMLSIDVPKKTSIIKKTFNYFRKIKFDKRILKFIWKYIFIPIIYVALYALFLFVAHLLDLIGAPWISGETFIKIILVGALVYGIFYVLEELIKAPTLKDKFIFLLFVIGAIITFIIMISVVIIIFEKAKFSY